MTLKARLGLIMAWTASFCWWAMVPSMRVTVVFQVGHAGASARMAQTASGVAWMWIEVWKDLAPCSSCCMG